MKVLLITIILLISNCQNDKNDITKIEIRSDDFYTSTMIHVPCENFENYFKKVIHVTVINDKSIIKKFNKLIKSLKPDPTNYYPDVRAKLLIYNINGKVDTICMSLNGIVLNGKPMKMDKQLLKLVEQYQE